MPLYYTSFVLRMKMKKIYLCAAIFINCASINVRAAQLNWKKKARIIDLPLIEKVSDGFALSLSIARGKRN